MLIQRLKFFDSRKIVCIIMFCNFNMSVGAIAQKNYSRFRIVFSCLIETVFQIRSIAAMKNQNRNGLFSILKHQNYDFKGIDQDLYLLEYDAVQYRIGIDFDLQLLFLTAWDETNDIAALHTE